MTEHTRPVPGDVRDAIRTMFRGRGQDYMSAEMELERLLRDNPGWRDEIVAAVVELTGDAMYDWSSALAVLESQGLVDGSWRSRA